MSVPGSLWQVCLAAGAIAACSGCRPEEKVVSYKPFFAGLEGVQTQTPAVIQKSQGPIEDGGELKPEELVQENPDGTKVLISRSGSQLMYHIQNTLAENDDKLFAEQVLSEATRQEFKANGRDPREAFAMLKPHQKDIGKLFARMPMGEYSPNVMMETVDRNMFRVKLTGQAARDLGRYSGFDMVLENGNWKLRWFVQ